ncbi:hypothetical protein SCUCBS95973_003390 [Sporothrix curviconia]|uniref:LrgB-like protein n=1 Tax=Sporothrix curviconia TaxID=1260050 RepID=A0ABP0BEY2_9PEZI
MLVAAVMILASKFVANLDGLYQRYLRAPTDLLNRHMSIGFTVPFTMIMDGPMSSSRNIGLIIAGYILMSIHRKDGTLRDIQHSSNSGMSPLDLAPPVIPAVRVDSYSSLGGPLVRMTSRQQPAQTLPQGLVPVAPTASQGRVQSYISASTTLNNNSNNNSSSPFHSASETDAERAVSPLGLLHPVAAQNPAASSDPEKAHVTQTQKAPRVLQRLACFAAASPVLCCSLVCIPLVGVPVSLCTHNDTALDTFLLVFLWTGSLAAQAAVRHTSFTFWTASLENRARARSVLATLLNAVLWSSLGTIAYLAAKAAARHRSIDDALSAFSTGTSLADLIAHPPPSSTAPRATMLFGAGDLASSVLDAGIVSWGLKLFECRAQLLSRAGLTTLVVGAVFAVGNIVCGPLLVHSMGLASPAKQLAFAARSVTLALAGPAMTNLGGDVGLNAAMVVFNGIVFQVAMGLGVCRWASRLMASASASTTTRNEEEPREATASPASGFRCRMGSGCWRSSHSSGSSTQSDTESESDVNVEVPPRRVLEADRSPSAASSASSASSALSASSSTPFKDPFQDVEKTAGQPQVSSSSASASPSPLPYTTCGDVCFVHMRGGNAHVQNDNDDNDAESDTPGTVAAGMTVGINAAAMGTAYLYEDSSRAAPYAALSMTVFGVMTVVFTSIQPLAGWVMSHAG